MLLELIRLLIDGMLWFSLSLSQSGFPRPFTAAQERECLRRLAAGERSARAELIERNLRLVAHVAKKYLQNGAELDELVSVGTVGLIKAVDTFDVNRAARFATYAARCIENELLMQFRSARRTRGTIYLSDPIEGADAQGGALTVGDVVRDDTDLAADCERKTDLERLRALSEGLFGRERRIIRLRYGMDGAEPLTQQQVANRLGISRSYVSRIEKRALQRLRERLEQRAP